MDKPGSLGSQLRRYATCAEPGKFVQVILRVLEEAAVDAEIGIVSRVCPDLGFDRFHELTGLHTLHILGVYWPKRTLGYGRQHPGGRDD